MTQGNAINKMIPEGPLSLGLTSTFLGLTTHLSLSLVVSRLTSMDYRCSCMEVLSTINQWVWYKE